nr:hypothetical protein [Tanacetum cinerariifolium]
KIDSLLDEFAGKLVLLKSIPPGIDITNCDPEEEICLIEKLLYDNSSPQLLRNDSISLLENESFHFDISSSPRPPAKPPDDDEIKPNSGILTVKVNTDIKEKDKIEAKTDKIRQEMKSVEKSIKSKPKSKSNQSKPGTNLERA